MRRGEPKWWMMVSLSVGCAVALVVIDFGGLDFRQANRIDATSPNETRGVDKVYRGSHGLANPYSPAGAIDSKAPLVLGVSGSVISARRRSEVTSGAGGGVLPDPLKKIPADVGEIVAYGFKDADPRRVAKTENTGLIKIGREFAGSPFQSSSNSVGQIAHYGDPDGATRFATRSQTGSRPSAVTAIGNLWPSFVPDSR